MGISFWDTEEHAAGSAILNEARDRTSEHRRGDAQSRVGLPSVATRKPYATTQCAPCGSSSSTKTLASIADQFRAAGSASQARPAGGGDDHQHTGVLAVQPKVIGAHLATAGGDQVARVRVPSAKSRSSSAAAEASGSVFAASVGGRRRCSDACREAGVVAAGRSCPAVCRDRRPVLPPTLGGSLLILGCRGCCSTTAVTVPVGAVLPGRRPHPSPAITGVAAGSGTLRQPNPCQWPSLSMVVHLGARRRSSHR